MTLHPTQQAVVDHETGPAAVIAGAGSGKTRTLVERAKRLVESGVNPRRILLLVYNASAREVIVNRLRGHRAAGVDVKTFHSFGQALCFSTCQGWMTGRRLIDADDGPKKVSLAYQAMKLANINVGEWKEWVLIADTSREKLIEPCDVYSFGVKLGIPTELRQKAQDFCEAYAELKERQHLYDFTDQLWQVYLQHRADPSLLPGEYDHLMIDEAQDATPLRWFVADAIGEKAKSYMAVGDLSQCQPAGSQVLTPSGYRNIETLRDGEIVCDWSRDHHHVFSHGGSAIRVAQRPYSGWMYTVTTASGRTVQATDNHRWLTRWDRSQADELNAVYVMEQTKPLSYRVGWCKLLQQLPDGMASAHYKQRARLEQAEQLWIVEIHRERGNASIRESILSTRYQLPQLMFRANQSSMHHYTQERLDEAWSQLAVYSRAGFDRLRAQYDLPERGHYYIGMPSGRQTVFECTTAHLREGMMVPIWDGRTNYEWEAIAKVDRVQVTDEPVYSLDVQRHHSYVTDNGICTLNCVYGYQGAEPDIFQHRVRKWKTYFLPINWRSGTDIIKIGNRVVKGRPWNLLKETLAPEGAPAGRVQRLSWVAGRSSAPQAVAADIAERIKQGWKLDNSTAILCRTNAECAEFEVALLLNQIPCRTRKSTGSAWENTIGLQMLSYLRLAADPNAYDPAGLWDCVEQIYCHPNRFIRKADVLADRCEGTDPVIALAGSKVPKVADLGRLLLTLRHLEWPARVGRITSLLSEDIRARAGGEIDRTDEDKFGLVNVLGQTAKTYGHLDAIYDAIDAVAAAYGQPHVLLSTCHSAKGGEWPLTYLSLDGFAGKGSIPLADPEIRLLYVGVTRAEKELVVTATREENAGLKLLGLDGGGPVGGAGGGSRGGTGGGRSTSSATSVLIKRLTSTDVAINHMAFEAAEAASLPHEGFPEMMTPHDARVLLNDAAGDMFGPRGDNAIDALDTELSNEWAASERRRDEYDSNDEDDIPW